MCSQHRNVTLVGYSPRRGAIGLWDSCSRVSRGGQGVWHPARTRTVSLPPPCRAGAASHRMRQHIDVRASVRSRAPSGRMKRSSALERAA